MGTRLWSFFCSLKLAIVLASAATFLVMGGSLLIHFNPAVFGELDSSILAAWWQRSGKTSPSLTWWLPLTGSILCFLTLNAFCCFIDWARSWRKRWRKTGEYLIHAGFVMVMIAFFWGAVAGFRSEGNQLAVGETISLPKMSGFSLRLKEFEPVLNSEGMPLDMHNSLVLYHEGTPLREAVARINHPLTWGNLVVIPTSFGRFPSGFRFHWPGRGLVDLKPGDTLDLPAGEVLRIRAFFPDAVRTDDGGRLRRKDRIGNPALELELDGPYRTPWRGWYFLRDPIPFPLLEAGVRLWPVEPTYRMVSILTINRDPGSRLALAGGLLIFTGVLLAMVSYYDKRSRGDRPQVG